MRVPAKLGDDDDDDDDNKILTCASLCVRLLIKSH